MAFWRNRDDLQEAIQRWRDADLLSPETAQALRDFEARRRSAAPPPGASTRLADAAACVGISLVAAAALVLAIAQFENDLPAQLALLSIVGAIVLAASAAARRLRLAIASDIFAGIAALLWTACFLLTLEELSNGGSPALGWTAFCAAVALLGLAIWRALGSISAAALAVAGWIALPGALVAGDDYTFGADASAAATAAALALAPLAALFAVLAARYAAQRGWLDQLGVWCVAFVASGWLSLGVLVIAASRDEAEFDLALIIGAIAATALAALRREWVWLPAAITFACAAAAASAAEAGPTARTAVALLVLALSFIPFTPLAARLPAHWTTRLWELAFWAAGLAAAIAFAVSSAGWPAVGGVWGALILAAAAHFRRPLALAAGVIALYAVFLAVVIETFDSGAAAGFGTLAFGLLLLAAVLLWRRRRVDTDQARS